MRVRIDALPLLRTDRRPSLSLETVLNALDTPSPGATRGFGSLARAAVLAAGMAAGLAAAPTTWAVAPPPTVSFVAVHDVGTAWHYDYTLFGPLGDFESVNLLFDAAKYDNLVVDPGSYDPSVFSPLAFPPFLGGDGMVTVTNVSGAALPPTPGSTLTVSFDWLGAGSPGAQPFQHLDSGFSQVGPDYMTAAVPEPAHWAMLLGGLALLGPLASRASRRRG